MEAVRSAQARIDECRRRFRESGLPLFDEDFSASTNVFNRAAPLLALVFLGEMLGAIRLDWSLGANMAAIGGLAILLAAGMAVNHYRRRPLPRCRRTSAASSWRRSCWCRRSCR